MPLSGTLDVPRVDSPVNRGATESAGRTSAAAGLRFHEVATLAALGALVVGVGAEFATPLFGADIFLVMAVAISPKRPRRPRTATGWAVAALAATWLLAFIWNPSIPGAVATLRYLALAWTVPTLTNLLRSHAVTVAKILGGFAIFEAVVVLGQGLLGRRLGLGLLEAPVPFRSYGPGALAPTGTVHHADLHGWFIASVAAVIVPLALRKRIDWRFAAVVLGIGTAAAVASYRRVTILSWLAIGLYIVVQFVRFPANRRVAVRLAAVMLVAGVVLIPHAHDGWYSRAISADNGAGFDSGRSELTGQSEALFRDAPFTGVGPVQYLPALIARFPDLPGPTISHFVPILVTVEGGMPVAIALVALLAAATLRWVRRRDRLDSFATVCGLGMPLLAMMALTPLPTMYAIGPLLTALNLASIRVATEPASSVRETRAATG